MNDLEELKKKLLAIDTETVKAKSSLVAQYAKEKQRYSVGDTIASSHTTIIIDAVSYSEGDYGMVSPYAIYSGPELTKGCRNSVFDSDDPYNPVRLIKRGEQV